MYMKMSSLEVWSLELNALHEMQAWIKLLWQKKKVKMFHLWTLNLSVWFSRKGKAVCIFIWGSWKWIRIDKLFFLSKIQNKSNNFIHSLNI